MNPRVLVTEQLAPRGLEAMRDAGLDVDVQLGLSHEELLDAVRGAAALVVRSATGVTADVLEAGDGLVAQRALAFGMQLVAYDPYVSVERARQLGVRLARGLDELVREADFLTIHLPKTSETVGLVSDALLAQAKPTLRIVNTARGGIVDEAALARAVREGRIAGAALDVFATEPTTESPLFELDSVVVT